MSNGKIEVQQMRNPDLQEITTEDPSLKCGFCKKSGVNELEWGIMYKLDDLVVHYFCMLFSPALTQGGGDHEAILGFMPDDVKKELRRGQRLKCKYCKKSGATIGCFVRACRSTFHFPCGLANGVCFEFREPYPSYCVSHNNKLKPNEEEGQAVGGDDSDDESKNCLICFSEPEPKDQISTPCCKRWVFHRLCLKTYANAAGYEFSCPACKDKDTFVEVMKKDGIFVPDRDAKWESETGAYADFHVPYSRCDAKPCLCPNVKKREYNKAASSRWSIIRCSYCGSSGTHLRCSSLKSPYWKCSDCSSFENNRIRSSLPDAHSNKKHSSNNRSSSLVPQRSGMPNRLESSFVQNVEMMMSQGRRALHNNNPEERLHRLSRVAGGGGGGGEPRLRLAITNVVRGSFSVAARETAAVQVEFRSEGLQVPRDHLRLMDVD